MSVAVLAAFVYVILYRVWLVEKNSWFSISSMSFWNGFECFLVNGGLSATTALSRKAIVSSCPLGRALNGFQKTVSSMRLSWKKFSVKARTLLQPSLSRLHQTGSMLMHKTMLLTVWVFHASNHSFVNTFMDVLCFCVQVLKKFLFRFGDPLTNSF